MLTVLRHALYLALVFVVQTTWLRHLEIGAVLPDLVVLTLVFIALLAGQVEAAILGFLIGLCQDAYAPHDLGLNALAKTLVGFAVGVVRGGLNADAPAVQVAVLAVAVIAHDLIYYVGSDTTTISQVPYLMLRFGLARALYTSVVGLLVAYALRLRRELLPL